MLCFFVTAADLGSSPVLLSEKFKSHHSELLVYIALCAPGISNHTYVSGVRV